MDKAINETVAAAVADAGRYPFLFIGSGISRRYAQTPGWEGLLQAICDEVLGDAFAYASFKSQATVAHRNGEVPAVMPQVATLMERPVNSALFEKDAHSEFRARHKTELLGGASPMKLYIADFLQSFDISECEELAALRDAGREKVSGVITTNFDELCEAAFPGFAPYVGEADLLFSEQSYAQELYKIHGSVSDPASMVLTTADYAEFDSRRKYLAAKLLTIFIEYPVVFLGYSIQDKNIQAILEDISRCLPDDKLERLQRRLVFVEHGGPTQVSVQSLSFGGKMLTMTKISTDDFLSIYDALRATRKLYDTRFIREIRGSIFRLARSIDPTSDIVVSGADNVLNNLAEGQKIVVGVSVAPMHVGIPIKPEEIIEDVVLDNLHYDPKFVVEHYLNRFVRQYQNSMPVFKYIRDIDPDMVGKDISAYVRQLTSVDSFRTASIRKGMERQRQRFSSDLSVRGIERQTAPGSPFPFIPYLDEDDIDVDELEALLKERLVKTQADSGGKAVLLKDTYFRKCVRIYDFLRYK